jgi:myosin heavy subunit
MFLTQSDLSEEAILYVLRLRFGQGEIYTSVSSILVAVNPFRRLPIYADDTLEQYLPRFRQTKAAKKGAAPPHIYTVASAAYYNLHKSGENQSVLISGESGAGKTETAKHILNFIANASPKHGADGKSALEERVLQANPLIESFGNAKTVKNNNSSRFGKLIRIGLDEQGAITR